MQVYEATDWGLEAVPVIASLGRWAARSPLHDPTLPMSHVSIIMSLQTLLVARACATASTRGSASASASRAMSRTLHNGRLDVERASRSGLRCDASPARRRELAAVIHGGAPFETIRVEGDMELAKRFVTLFPLPPKGRMNVEARAPIP